MNETSLPGPIALTKSSFSFMKLHWRNFLAMFWPVILLGLLIQVSLSLVDGYIPDPDSAAALHGSQLALPFAVLGGFLVLEALLIIFSLACAIALIYYILGVNRGQAVTKRAAFAAAKSTFWPFVWVALLSMLVYAGGLVLLVIPAIAAMGYLVFASFLVIDGKRRGLNALSASARMVEGQWWAVFGRLVFMMLTVLVMSALSYLALLAVTSIGWVLFLRNVPYGLLARDTYQLGSIVFSALAAFFMYPYFCALYEAALANRQDALTDEKIEKTRKLFLGLSIWGIAASIILAAGLVAFIALAGYALNQNRGTAADLPSEAGNQVALIHEGSGTALAGSALLTYEDAEKTFSLQYPDSWTAYSLGDRIALEPPQNSVQGTSTAVVTIHPVDLPPGFTLDELGSAVDSQKASMAKSGQQLTDNGKTTFMGYPAFSYTTIHSADDADGGRPVVVRSDEILTVVNGRAYDIVYSQHAGPDDEARPVADKILGSIKFFR